MSNTPSVPPDRGERVQRVVAAYLAAEAAGGAPDRRALVEENPDLATELGAFFFEHDRSRALTDPMTPGTAAAHASTELGPEATAAYSGGARGGAPTPETVTEAADGGADPPAGTRVRYFGDYELLRQVGHGGMGVVYEARQVSLNRVVALKMIRSGLLATDEERQRFRNEAESVATLEHPNIVPILEVGEFEGRDYFTMKLVAGGSLSRRIAAFRADPRAAAALLVEVAAAVEHAHQRGVLHRDLKPANILLDAAGRPHVSDFGLAKRLGAHAELTLSGQLLGTPAYMSPEQATGRRGAGTTLSDVYGLGAVLYAALTGQAPFHGDTAVETLQRVREDAPERPSRLNPAVDRNLETVCLKCLEKDPARRYASARALADDLNRWLRGEPVVARPVGPLTRAALWGRRHPLTAALAAALVLAVTVGVAGVAWNWRVAVARGRDLAAANRRIDRERATVVAVNRFLTRQVLAQASPDANDRSRKLTLEEALDNAAAAIDAGFDGPPDVEASVRETIAQSYRALGRPDRAEPHLRKAHKLRSALYGPDDAETLTTEHNLAVLLIEAGALDEAGRAAGRVYDERLRRLGPGDPDTLHALETVGLWHHASGRPAAAEPPLRRAAEGLRAARGADHPEALAAEQALAATLQAQGRYPDAEPLFRHVFEARRRALRPGHPDTLRAVNNLGANLMAQKKLAAAEALFGEALEDFRRVVGPDHPDTLTAWNNLIGVLMEGGKLDDAERQLRAALDALKGKPDSDPHVLHALNNLGVLLLKRQKAGEAVPVLRQLVKARRAAGAGDDRDTLRNTANLTAALIEVGEWSEALLLLEELVPRYRNAFPPDDPELSGVLVSYGRALTETGKAAAALTVLQEALGIRTRVLPPDDWRLANTRSLLGGALAALKQFDSAEPYLRDSYAALRAAPGASPARVAEARARLVKLYEAWGRPEKAAPYRDPAPAAPGRKEGR